MTVTPATIAVERQPFRAEMPEKVRVVAPLTLTTLCRALPNMAAEIGVKQGSGWQQVPFWKQEKSGGQWVQRAAGLVALWHSGET